MSDQGYTTTFAVQRTPDQVYAAINDVRSWWFGDIEGPTDELGAEFTYRYEDLHVSRQKVTELVPASRVVWHVVDAELSFTRDKGEWKDTQIVFEISARDDDTEVRFTHAGLLPALECFADCSNAWGSYIDGSLRNRIVDAPARTP